jgi:hypothetical protein
MKKTFLRKTFLLSVIIIVFGVIFYNTKDLILGAPLRVSTIKNGATVSDSFLPILGTAKHSSMLQINGHLVAIGKDGVFSDGVLLSPGYNIIQVTTADRFGKEKIKIFHLVAEPQTPTAKTMSIHYQ